MHASSPESAIAEYVQHFDLSVSAWNCAGLPDLTQKIEEKLTFYGTVEIFHIVSAEFPFSEHGISISGAQNFPYLSVEFWAVCLEHHLSF